MLYFSVMFTIACLSAWLNGLMKIVSPDNPNENIIGGALIGATSPWILFVIGVLTGTLPDQVRAGAAGLSVEEFIFVIVLAAAIGAVVGTLIGFVIFLLRRGPSVLRSSAGTVIRNLSEAAQDVQKAKQSHQELERMVYDQIAAEIAGSRVDRGTWIEALERAKGDRSHAEAEYIRLRRKRLMKGRLKRRRTVLLFL